MEQTEPLFLAGKPLVYKNTAGILTRYRVPQNYKYEAKMLRISFQTLLLTVACITVPAGSALAAGDPEAGKVKSYTCTGCHGIPGYKNVNPTFHVPKIGGQNEAYLAAALKAYRDGERDHSTMVLQSQALSDQDIADIAAYFASLGEEE
jgi:cytochrome c553